jgi:sugar lactone lactonase YvrE
MTSKPKCFHSAKWWIEFNPITLAECGEDVDTLAANLTGHRGVTRREFDGGLTVLANSFQGRRLNRPNDVVVKSDGAIYSITSSARASSRGEISRPRALAVVRLMMRSNLVGCSTGMSLGFAPRRILST